MRNNNALRGTVVDRARFPLSANTNALLLANHQNSVTDLRRVQLILANFSGWSEAATSTPSLTVTMMEHRNG